MRFDDSLDTVLAADTSTAFGAESAWRQLTDLVGRRRVGAPAAIERLRAIRPQVPPPVRAATARGLAFVTPPAGLVALFAEDAPGIAAPVVATAQLSDAEWLGMIPALSPTSRGLLRHRRDLAPAVRRALDSFGASDFALPEPDGTTAATIAEPSVPPPANDIAPPPAIAPSDQGGAFAIAELVARLDAYERDHGDLNRAPAAFSNAAPVDHFAFETDALGMIRWVEGAPREPLVGVVLGSAKAPTDAIIAGAMRRRSPFADARLDIPGMTAAGGDWQVSAIPAFEPVSGRFTGYRGIARRPRADERAAPLRAAPAAEALRAVVHELRTPTNAISGFAEMIETEMLGPAPTVYRERAALIRSDTHDLLAAIDDVDTAARIDQGALELRSAVVPIAPVLARAATDLESLLRLRRAILDIDSGPDELAVAGDPVAVARLVARLLSLCVGPCAPGERISVDTAPDASSVVIAFDRPAALAAEDEAALLALDQAGEGGSLLGIGFSLRLARNLALELGGGLTIGPVRLTLRLPAALDQGVGQQSTN